MVKQPTLNEQVKDVRFTCIVKIIPIVYNYPNLDKYNKKLFICIWWEKWRGLENVDDWILEVLSKN